MSIMVAEGKMVQEAGGAALRVANGNVWELSETAITATKDIIVKEGGKVVSHVQVKDTVNCINKTIQKASIGECSAVQVSGTAELATKAAENTKQLAGTTGKQIAGKALSRMPSASAIGAAAKAGGVVGATVGAGIEAMYSVGEVIRGKKDVFPLLIGVAAGVALERYYLSDEADEGCKEKEKVKDDVKAKAQEAKSSIMDFINSAKRHHPVLLPRRGTAKKLMIMLAGEEDGTITKEIFDRTKTVVEEYCGIRKWSMMKTLNLSAEAKSTKSARKILCWIWKN